MKCNHLIISVHCNYETDCDNDLKHLLLLFVYNILADLLSTLHQLL